MISVKRLSIEDARILIEGARAKSVEIDLPMCIAVTDDSGNLIAFERMDGGKAHSITVAQDKAFTAGAARKATHEYNAVNTPGSLAFGIHTEHGGRLSSVGGGLPVMVDGECLGGIGASSGTPQQDMDVSQAGIDHFLAMISN
ncbi:MAG: GlcG/HbpS family heme-binding protein [Candidatus Azotimanducaceae bacterium]|uniref:Heme-binding protein n=1 Tax=OM182 bacterium TaxID=2510334 RepID=A0A520S4D8_9GAMM|nr:DNA polymerase III subunit delta' [Gammaproteobacteria bacterium]OUV68157.1 MAG: DNA polymerase III subunit delta' [Gammaproteobacteria bacterium TMED133]RZO77355.1 MAG: heme-binding protein [OM182 bacterium]